MAGKRAGSIWNAVACGALILVIVGLLVATWMPAIVAARAQKESATQPAKLPETAPVTQPATQATTQP